MEMPALVGVLALTVVVFLAEAEDLALTEVPFAASNRDFCVTPVALAIFLSCSWVKSASPRSTLLTSDADTPPPILRASCSWVMSAARRASLVSLPTLFAIVIRAFVVDGAIENFNSSKFLRIITDKEEKILHYIMHDLERGASVVNNCTGAYTNNEKRMIISVMDKREAVKVKKMIKQIDPVAFVIVGTTNDIQGDGFKPLS